MANKNEKIAQEILNAIGGEGKEHALCHTLKSSIATF